MSNSAERYTTAERERFKSEVFHKNCGRARVAMVSINNGDAACVRRFFSRAIAANSSDRYPARRDQGPWIANVSPGSCTLTNIVRPSAEKHAPASS